MQGREALKNDYSRTEGGGAKPLFVRLLRHAECSPAMQMTFTTGDGDSPRDCSMAVAVMFHSVLGRARCEPGEVIDLLQRLNSGGGAGSYRTMAQAAFRLACLDGSPQLLADIVRSSEDPSHPCAAADPPSPPIKNTDLHISGHWTSRCCVPVTCAHPARWTGVCHRASRYA